MGKMIVFAVCFIFVPLSSAYQEPGWLPASVKRRTFEIGPEIYYFQYKEPGLMKNKGMFKGVSGAYTYRGWIPENPEQPLKDVKLMFRIEGRFASGRVDYDGAVWGGTANNVDNIDDLTTEFRFLLGSDYPKKNRIDTVYLGLGFRYLNDKGPKDSIGYDRESIYCYVPIGLRTERLLKDGWSFGATGEFDVFLVDFFLVEEEEDDFSDSGDTDAESRQFSGFGLRGSVRLEKQFKESSFKIEPFVRFWYIPTSEEDESRLGFEPKNNTIEYGVQFMWTF
jgi:hypothetical protein